MLLGSSFYFLARVFLRFRKLYCNAQPNASITPGLWFWVKYFLISNHINFEHLLTTNSTAYIEMKATFNKHLYKVMVCSCIGKLH